MKKGRWPVFGYAAFLGAIAALGFITGSAKLSFEPGGNQSDTFALNGADVLDIRSNEVIDDFRSGPLQNGFTAQTSNGAQGPEPNQDQSNVSVYEENQVDPDLVVNSL